MRGFLSISLLLLSVAVPVTHICAQVGPDPSNMLHTATSGTLMGRYQGLRGWVVSLDERRCYYSADGSTLSPDSSSRRYWFDAHGNIVSIVSTAWGEYPSCDTLAFVYDHRARLSSTVLFSHGDTVARYLYNDTTDRIRRIDIPSGHPIAHITYQYSPQGWCKTAHGNKGEALLQTCYRDGRLVSMIDYDASSGDPSQLLTVARHDGNGNPLVMADVLQPDEPRLQTLCDFDPYGNLLLFASEHDTQTVDYTRYDLTHNWLRCEQVDNGRPDVRITRTIRYATDSADFRDVYRLHDPFWNDNNPTGFLEMRYPNGDYYLGNLLQGQPHGTGDLTLASGTTFSGSFDHGRYQGAGILRRDGAEIHASWQHGHIVTSHVTILYADGSTYSGEYHPEDDSCRYRGRTELADGGSYTGEYALGRYDGEGTLRLADGTLYEGTWEHGKPHGEMLVVMPNLDRHHARFSHGRRVGVSTIEYINGDLYRGETDQQGLPDGMGTYTTAAGKARTGYWSEGRYKGRHRPAFRNTKH